jgi:peroxiredoxin
MKLVPGTPAPQFEAEDIFGNPIDLKQYAGKPVLLSFFRNGACAICNLQVHKLIRRYPDFHQQGLEVIAMFESPRSSVLEYVSKQDAPFPIIADPEARLYDLYGVETDEVKVMAAVANPRHDLIQEAEAIGYKLTHEEGSNFFRLPADFLICPSQDIDYVFYSDIVGDHIAFKTIEQFLDKLPAMF